MIEKLSAFNLGVCMPHIHNAEGAFEAMPQNVVQIEDDLRISFPTQEQFTASGNAAIASSPAILKPGKGFTLRATSKRVFAGRQA